MKSKIQNGVHTPRNGNGVKRGGSHGLFAPKNGNRVKRSVLEDLAKPDKEFRLTAAEDIVTPPQSIVYRLYLGFVYDKDRDVNGLALGVIDGLTDNPAFPNLPYTAVQLTVLQQDYSAKLTASRARGSDRILAKNLARKALTDALVADALYCQGVARYSLADLLSTGFDVCSRNRSQGPLDPPSIQAIVNGMAGELILRCTGVVNAHSYQPQMSTDEGKTWTDLDQVTGVRHISVPGLTAGQVYTFHIRAVGGTKKYSDWSAPMSHMVI